MSMNVRFNVEDYKSKRVRDTYSMVTAMALSGLSTIELVQYFVSIVADEYPDKQFDIDFDGVYELIIKCDNEVIYEGNLVDIENMFREGTYVFRDKLIEKTN